MSDYLHTSNGIPLDLLDKLQEVKPTGNGYQACCPAHEDTSPSLSIGLGEGGRILLKCHAGCAVEDIVAAVGMMMADLMGSSDGSVAPASPAQKPQPRMGYTSLRSAADALARNVGHVEAVYEYPSADGTIDFAVVRILQANGKKTFRPLHRIDGKWLVGDPPGLLPLFNLPALADATEVLVVEGEKCALAATGLGFVVTTSSHGAKSAAKTDWSPLAGKRVGILPDNDDAGRAHATDVAGILGALTEPASVRHLNLPDLPPGGDIVDWIEAQAAKGLEPAEIAEALSRMLESAQPAQSPPNIADSADIADGVQGSPWPPPLALTQDVALPAFPIDSFFPTCLQWARDYAVAVAHSLQVPVDAVVMSMLPPMALPLSKQFVVRPSPDWEEPISIYSLLVMPSGEKKSGFMKRLSAPILEWQRARAAAMAPMIASHENKIQIAKAKLDQARRVAATEGPPADLDALAEEHARLEASRPRPPRLVATEATSEALIRTMAQNGERAIVIAAEGDALDVMLGRYQKSPNMGIWLAGHAGDAIQCDRLGRAPEYLAQPALQVSLSVQPEAIVDLLGSSMAVGRGLLARMFLCAPRSIMGKRVLNPDPIPPHLSRRFADTLRKHLDCPLPDRPLVIELDHDAHVAFQAFRAHIEPQLDPALSHDSIRAWLSKLPGAILRIAGVLAAFEPTPHPRITGEIMRCALEIYPYLMEHYQHVMDLAGIDPAVSLARNIEGWLQRGAIDSFTERDALNKFKGRGLKAEDVKAAIEVLVNAHRVRLLLPPCRNGRGRPGSPRYEVNPALRPGGDPHPQYPQYPQNDSTTQGGAA